MAKPSGSGRNLLGHDRRGNQNLVSEAYCITHERGIIPVMQGLDVGVDLEPVDRARNNKEKSWATTWIREHDS